jgi:pimeloyl-ACP methyl ester carboxylesterase
MTSLMNRTSEIARMASTSAISKVIQSFFGRVAALHVEFHTFIHDLKRKIVMHMHGDRSLCNTVRMSSPTPYSPSRGSQRKEFDIRGARYSVTEWGERGAPLFFYLHGWADTGSTFQFVVDALQDDWHVVAPDWRGFGRSTANCAAYWFPDYLADLHELLELYTPRQPARLVGHSMGANVAGLYAGTIPERVEAFVNIEGFGLVESDPADAPGRYRKWIEASQSKPAFSTYPDLGALSKRIAKRHPRMNPAHAGFVAAEWGAEQEDGRVILRADPLHKLPNPILYRRAAAEACWRAITAQVLLVTGGESEIAQHLGVDDGVDLPHDQSVCIPKAGHMPHFDTPVELAAAIESFLRQYL